MHLSYNVIRIDQYLTHSNSLKWKLAFMSEFSCGAEFASWFLEHQIHPKSPRKNKCYKQQQQHKTPLEWICDNYMIDTNAGGFPS